MVRSVGAKNLERVDIIAMVDIIRRNKDLKSDPMLETITFCKAVTEVRRCRKAAGIVGEFTETQVRNFFRNACTDITSGSFAQNVENSLSTEHRADFAAICKDETLLSGQDVRSLVATLLQNKETLTNAEDKVFRVMSISIGGKRTPDEVKEWWHSVKMIYPLTGLIEPVDQSVGTDQKAELIALICNTDALLQDAVLKICSAMSAAGKQAVGQQLANH